MGTGPKFFQTRMGTRFFEADLPRIIKALEKIGAALAKEPAPKEETAPRDTDYYDPRARKINDYFTLHVRRNDWPEHERLVDFLRNLDE